MKHHLWLLIMMVMMAVSPAQCRAARGLLGWSQRQLAGLAGVGVVTVHQFEAGISEPRRATVEVIRRAFEAAGILFIDADDDAGPGVRLRKMEPRDLHVPNYEPTAT